MGVREPRESTREIVRPQGNEKLGRDAHEWKKFATHGSNI